jgi:polysaccharide pyruvyl transferase WcaK-like protein
MKMPLGRASQLRRPEGSQRLTFFGNFGARNLGNEYTLRAIVESARAYLPGASINCVCTNPQETTATHGIPAVLISYRYELGSASTGPRQHDNPAIKLMRRVFVRVPLELTEWVRAFRALRGTTMLVMTGTGMLSDFGIGPLDLHYEILKWSILAKLRGCALLFVSVGAGPIASPLSRWIVKSALALADYRSYRDSFSRHYLASIGFDVSRDSVYPDLVFSLTPENPPPQAAVGPDQAGRRLVGLGLMDYYGQHAGFDQGERIYRRYVQALARFAKWLLEHGYLVRLLTGDLNYDRRVRADLLGALAEMQRSFDQDRIIDEPPRTAEQLDEQIAQADLVVATRFHNVLVSLLRNRPVIAVSYHAKVRALMAEAGLEEFCQDANDLDVDDLIKLFRKLESNSEALRGSMRRTAERYRRALDEQYEHIFGDLGRAA